VDNSKYLDDFIVEANEYLQILNKYLLELEEAGEKFKEVDELFRAVHSLKGMAGAMNFGLLVDLTHSLENIFDLIRKEEILIDSELINILFSALDQLELIIQEISQNGKFKPENFQMKVEELISQLDNHECKSKSKGSQNKNGLYLDKEDILKIKEELEDNKNCLEINIELNADTQLKSARAFMIINQMQSRGRIIKSDPELALIEAGELDCSVFRLLLSTLKSTSEIESVISDETDLAKLEVNKLDIDDLNIAQDSSTGTNAEERANNFNLTSTVRVDVGRLDELMNLVGELMINKSQINELNYDSKHLQEREAMENVDRVTDKLHRIIMDLRMTPLNRVTNRLPRMARDLAKEMNKKIDLEIEGQETELDRVIIEELSDPLIHLLRNCIDHGIENPKERIERGKDEIGTISIIATQKGNTVEIVIKDDGAGINIESIKEKVIENGLVNHERLTEMSDNEIVDLIFAPGLSTAQGVTDISGRGVGMDVVKNTIESLGGQIKVKSELGIGTEFIIRLPLTLAIVEALLIKVKEETYVLPLSIIDEVYDLSKQDIKYMQGKEFFILRDEMIPVVYLHDKLGFKKSDLRSKDEFPMLIVSDGEERIGIIVDELISQQKIVVKPLGGFLDAILTNVSGATILGTGEVVLILDVRNIAS